jgi:hypothetical protein
LKTFGCQEETVQSLANARKASRGMDSHSTLPDQSTGFVENFREPPSRIVALKNVHFWA